MADRWVVESDAYGWIVALNSGRHRGAVVAEFPNKPISCPNAEREARNLCRRLNAAAKKGKGKR